jgi:hypothetical protein
MFDRIANGKNEIVLSEVTDPRSQWFLNRIVQTANITNGRITRDQYINATQQMFSQFRRDRGQPTDSNSGPPSNRQGNAGASGENMDEWAEAEFKRRDRNGDGVLSEDEMGRSLRAVFQLYDANKDGVIDLKEFKAYYADQVKQRQNQLGGAAVVAVAIEQEEKKPPVYRAGKLPKGIPDWFAQLDTDKDGQIGLYEWVASGRPIEQFLAMDRNNDGFLTIDEVMRAQPKGGTRSGRGGPMTTVSRGPDGNNDTQASTDRQSSASMDRQGQENTGRSQRRRGPPNMNRGSQGNDQSDTGNSDRRGRGRRGRQP